MRASNTGIGTQGCHVTYLRLHYTYTSARRVMPALDRMSPSSPRARASARILCATLGSFAQDDSVTSTGYLQSLGADRH